MSGHSKWHNIKLKKGKVDGQRGALFTKLSKEIILAAKNGSADPEANYRLKMAVDKARANNMPQDNIKRAIARGSGADNEKPIEELRYEGYGPANIAVIIEAATDNRNRTASELRFLFSRNDGALGETGSVGWIFEQRGVIEVDPQKLLRGRSHRKSARRRRDRRALRRTGRNRHGAREVDGGQRRTRSGRSARARPPSSRWKRSRRRARAPATPIKC